MGSEHPGFFDCVGPYSLREVAKSVEAVLPVECDADLLISDVRPLSNATPGQLTFLDNRKYAEQLASTRASACLLQPAFADRAPAGTVALTMKAPYHGFARALQLFYPGAMRPPGSDLEADGGANRREYGGFVHDTAEIGKSAVIEAGAVVGRQAKIGRGSRIASGAVIGYRVHIGTDCHIGPCASITHSLVGHRVIIHAGVRIGQDGFGFAMGAGGHLKVPQIGRVVIHDDVEIGANSCIDRGALSDTVIGEGCKIDDLVMIGHNVVLGKHCVIVSQCGIAGSACLGDFVVMGGHAGVVGHVKVGSGAQIAGSSHVKDDVPAGAVMGGTPARPFREWAREIAAIRRLATKKGGSKPDG